MKKVAYFTNIAPHYREKLWLAFTRKLGVELHFFYGYSPKQSIKSIDFEKEEWLSYKDQIHLVKNYKLKHRIIFQRRVLKNIYSKQWDAIILLGDANIISNWLAAILAKSRGIPVIFWGHGIYGNESSFKKKVLKYFLSIPDIIMVYGHWAKNLLIKENFDADSIEVIYNSINYNKSKKLRQKAIKPNFYYSYFNNHLPTLIFIGRLTKVKRLHLLIEALHKLNKRKRQFNLIMIGDGEVRENLEKLAKDLNEEVYFYGACYEEEKISQFLANADLCVSPGNVGLTSIHAMSYGTPVCTNDDFKNQMPEFEAIIPRETGSFFGHNTQNLSHAIKNWFEESEDRETVRQRCYHIIDKYYNPNVQVKVMKGVLNNVIPSSPRVAYFTNIAPHYRNNLWLAFNDKLNVELHFFSGFNANQTIAPIDFNSEEWKALKKQLHRTQNFKIGKRLIFQTNVIRQVLFKKWDCLLLLGDANIISNWIISAIAKIKGIPIIFWGHGMYGKENVLKKMILKLFLSFPDKILVYGHWARNLLIKENFKPSSIDVIYNSINYEICKSLRHKAIIPDYYKNHFNNNLPVLIFIGRLTKEKKLHLLIQALHQLNSSIKSYNLMIVGDGKVRSALEKQAKELNENVHFYGACYDEAKISKLIANADLCVSPGNVGLTSVHAMSYGTPVCTTNDFKNQGPEFEAVKVWETGCFFDQKKVNLAVTINKWFMLNIDREMVRQACYNVVDKYYNPKVQVKVLKNVLDEVLDK